MPGSGPAPEPCGSRQDADDPEIGDRPSLNLLKEAHAKSQSCQEKIRTICVIRGFFQDIHHSLPYFLGHKERPKDNILRTFSQIIRRYVYYDKW